MSEKRTVVKWWWVWDFDKEEEWLNEMTLQGWALSAGSRARKKRSSASGWFTNRR